MTCVCQLPSSKLPLLPRQVRNRLVVFEEKLSLASEAENPGNCDHSALVAMVLFIL